MFDKTFDIKIKTAAELAALRDTQQELGGTKKRVDERGESTSKINLGDLASKATVALAGVASLAAGLREALAAAGESEQAALQLNTVLANTGQLSEEASGAIQELASSYQALTNVSDETWTQAAAKLVEFGAEVERIPEYFPIIEGLAGRLGGNVPQAAELLARALAGNTRGLAQLGIQLEEGATKMQILEAVTQAASTGMGVLRNQAQTLNGSMEGLKLAVGDVFESVGALINSGGVLAGFFRTFATGVKGIADALPASRDNTIDLAQAQKQAANSANLMAKAMSGIEEPAKRAAEGIREAKKEAQELARALNEAVAATERLRNREDAGTDAQADLENAKVDAALANKTISPAEAAEQKARIKANADSTKLDRKERDERAALGRNQQAVKALEAESEFNEALAGDASLPQDRRAKARARVEAIAEELAAIDQEIADREAALKNFPLALEAIKTRQGTEESKAAEMRAEADREAQKKSLRSQKAVAQAEIEALEAAKDPASPDYPAQIARIVELKKKLLDLSDVEAALEGAQEDAKVGDFRRAAIASGALREITQAGAGGGSLKTKAGGDAPQQAGSTLDFGGGGTAKPSREAAAGGGLTSGGLRTGGLTTGGLRTGGLQTGGLTTGSLSPSGSTTDFDKAFKFRIDTRQRAQRQADESSGGGAPADSSQLQNEARRLMQGGGDSGGLQSIISDLMKTLGRERAKRKEEIEEIKKQMKNGRS